MPSAEQGFLQGYRTEELLEIVLKQKRQVLMLLEMLSDLGFDLLDLFDATS